MSPQRTHRRWIPCSFGRLACLRTGFITSALLFSSFSISSAEPAPVERDPISHWSAVIRENAAAGESSLRHREAQQALLALPGHARHFLPMIEGAVASTDGDSAADGRAEAFDILAQLPSAETVEVLGDLLERPLPPVSETAPVPVAVMAARSLGRLIESPPVPKSWDLYNAGDIGTWRAWYDGVKAGAAFRFRGNPQEVHLSPPSLATTPTSSSVPVELPSPASSVHLIAMVVGVLGLLWIFSLWQILRSSRRDEG